MKALQLSPHPDFPSIAVTAITVDAGRREGGQLVLRFHVEGDLEGAIWPEFDGPAGREDGLWQHSCFEAFVGVVGEPGYCELNFATSAKWAAYRFDDYRAGMRDLDHVAHSGNWTMPPSEMKARFVIRDLDQPREWRLGVSVIIEAKDGSKSYWALKHPPGKPDFHHADCFAARIAAPDAA
jgi:hypothetical protein